MQMAMAEHPDISKFNNPLETFGLAQQVQIPTHSSGHALDLLITKAHESPVLGL